MKLKNDWNKSLVLWRRSLMSISTEPEEGCFVPDFDEDTEPTHLIPCSKWTKEIGNE